MGNGGKRQGAVRAPAQLPPPTYPRSTSERIWSAKSQESGTRSRLLAQTVRGLSGGAGADTEAGGDCWDREGARARATALARQRGRASAERDEERQEKGERGREGARDCAGRRGDLGMQVEDETTDSEEWSRTKGLLLLHADRGVPGEDYGRAVIQGCYSSGPARNGQVLFAAIWCAIRLRALAGTLTWRTVPSAYPYVL
eukprot:2247052-Rhodomonas_salina.1